MFSSTDLDAEDKHLIAKQVLSELWTTRTGVLSTQVLQEFYVNVTRKLARPLTKKVARTAVDAYSLWCIDTTPAELKSAFQIEDDARLGFWDALICAAALKAGVDRILSEDLNAGQKIAGIRIENPFVRKSPKAGST
jgi:predicted nucleic acid-binding protein